MPRREDRSEVDKVRLFRDSVYYEIVHTFGVPGGLTDDQLADHAVGEVVNFSRQVHARLLAQSLLRKPGDQGVRADDVLADDFGLDAEGLGLPTEFLKGLLQLDHLNKGLFHLSYGRVTGATRKPWDTRLLRELLPITISFMRHIRDNPVRPGGLPLFAGENDRLGWGELLDALENCQGGRRLRFESGPAVVRTWYRVWTEPGSITSLYGARVMPTPTGAVVQESVANNVTTRWTYTPHEAGGPLRGFESDGPGSPDAAG